MTLEKARFGIVISKELEKKVSTEVKKGLYLKLTRSEVIAELLEIVFDQVRDKDKFSEGLRGRIIKRRKQF